MNWFMSRININRNLVRLGILGFSLTMSSGNILGTFFRRSPTGREDAGCWGKNTDLKKVITHV